MSDPELCCGERLHSESVQILCAKYGMWLPLDSYGDTVALHEHPDLFPTIDLRCACVRGGACYGACALARGPLPWHALINRARTRALARALKQSNTCAPTERHPHAHTHIHTRTLARFPPRVHTVGLIHKRTARCRAVEPAPTANLMAPPGSSSLASDDGMPGA